MLSCRWRGKLLAVKKIDFIVRSVGAEEQNAELQESVRRHDSLVAENAKRSAAAVYATYTVEAAMHYPAFNLAVLPPTSGVHRADLRMSLAEHVTEEFRRCVVGSWASAAERQVLVTGCRSVAYLQRQLALDDAHAFLVVDHSLSALVELSAALVPSFGSRAQFVRGDSFFLLQCLLPPTVADVCVAPMPVPFASESGSYRRLVTRDFLCALHRVLRVREGPADPRGFVAFTDFAPLADFMMEQLEESRLVVPWARKNPKETYGRWLPIQNQSCREFTQQRLGEIVALAVSKSGSFSVHAERLVQSIDYKRRYYRALTQQSDG